MTLARRIMSAALIVGYRGDVLPSSRRAPAGRAHDFELSAFRRWPNACWFLRPGSCRGDLLEHHEMPEGLIGLLSERRPDGRAVKNGIEMEFCSDHKVKSRLKLFKTA